jgi:hypothetical protein
MWIYIIISGYDINTKSINWNKNRNIYSYMQMKQIIRINSCVNKHNITERQLYVSNTEQCS